LDFKLILNVSKLEFKNSIETQNSKFKILTSLFLSIRNSYFKRTTFFVPRHYYITFRNFVKPFNPEISLSERWRLASDNNYLFPQHLINELSKFFKRIGPAQETVVDEKSRGAGNTEILNFFYLSVNFLLEFSRHASPRIFPDLPRILPPQPLFGHSCENPKAYS